jgi:hypothetical protein
VCHTPLFAGFTVTLAKNASTTGKTGSAAMPLKDEKRIKKKVYSTRK